MVVEGTVLRGRKLPSRQLAVGGRALCRLLGRGVGSVPTPQALRSANRRWLSIREPITWQVPKQVFELRDVRLAQAGAESDLYLPALGRPHGGPMAHRWRGLSCPRWETRESAPELGAAAAQGWGASQQAVRDSCPMWVQPQVEAAQRGVCFLISPFFRPLYLPSDSGGGGAALPGPVSLQLSG